MGATPAHGTNPGRTQVNDEVVDNMPDEVYKFWLEDAGRSLADTSTMEAELFSGYP